MARDAFAAGELDRTLAAADDAYRAWNGAWQEGRRRALLALAVLATLVVIGSALIGRARRSRLRPPLAAAVLAISLVAGAALVPPAMGTRAPNLGWLAPPVVAAATDLIDISTATRYVVDPAGATVRVTVDITAVNNKPPLVSGGIVKRFFYDGVNLGVQREATGFRATQDGVPVRVTTVPGKGYRMVTVLFRQNLFYQQAVTLHLTFSLPSGKPRSDSDIRVGPAFATFLAWAFGDRGTVRVEVPAGFAVSTSGGEVARTIEAAGLQVLSATTDSAPAWYLWVNARNDDGLTRQQVTFPGGKVILVRGWPADRSWRTRVAGLLSQAVPSLLTRIGLPWPVAGALSVIEIHTPLLEGYGGFYDVQTDRITISEDLDDVTIVHEASHAWFNNHLFRDRWIDEGLAEEYATRVLAGLGRTPPRPLAVSRTSKVAFALNDWPPPAPIHDQVADSRELYGYEAAWYVVGAVVKSAGEDGMRRVFTAADRGTTAYVGRRAPERTSLPNDWRRFLDLVEELGGADGATALVSTWVVAPGDRAALVARADARATSGSWSSQIVAGARR